MSSLRVMPRRLCILELRPEEACDELLDWNAAEPLMESGLFDRLVLCVADRAECLELRRFAEVWGIEIYYGDAEDVIQRLQACAKAATADVVARVRVPSFGVEPEIVAAQIALLESDPEADYIRLPRDVDVRFGADVFRPRLLDKLALAFRDPGMRSRMAARPWGFLEAYPRDFEIRTAHDLPVLAPERLERLREGFRVLGRRRARRTQLFPYQLAVESLPLGGAALDIACRDGVGTAILSTGGEALGVDADEEAVHECKERWLGTGEFIYADGMELVLPRNHFDVVTSMHTLNKIEDDAGFLERVHHWMKPSGVLYLEVPLFQLAPFEDAATKVLPLDPRSRHQYTPTSFVELVEKNFQVRDLFGESRGAYVDEARARGALLVIATPRAA